MKWPLFKAPSTSKVVFLLIAFTACGAFLLKILEAKEFMTLAVMAFSFYFSIKSPGSADDTTPIAGTTKTTSATTTVTVPQKPVVTAAPIATKEEKFEKVNEPIADLPESPFNPPGG